MARNRRVRNGRSARTERKSRADKRFVEFKEEIAAVSEDPAEIARYRISVLDARLGIGVGAKRERAALAKRINA